MSSVNFALLLTQNSVENKLSDKVGLTDKNALELLFF